MKSDLSCIVYKGRVSFAKKNAFLREVHLIDSKASNYCFDNCNV